MFTDARGRPNEAKLVAHAKTIDVEP